MSGRRTARSREAHCEVCRGAGFASSPDAADSTASSGGDLLGGGVTADQPQRRLVGNDVVGCHQSGMFPCFLGGSVSRLVRSARSALVTFIRVLEGVMTVSM